MTIHVHFFGHYSDYFPSPLAVTIKQGATVRDLAEQLAAGDTRLSKLTAHCRFAVGDEYAALEQALEEANTVAVLPPMSGG